MESCNAYKKRLKTSYEQKLHPNSATFEMDCKKVINILLLWTPPGRRNKGIKFLSLSTILELKGMYRNPTSFRNLIGVQKTLKIASSAIRDVTAVIILAILASLVLALNNFLILFL